MTWSKDNTISVLALLATCVPIFVLLAACLLRQRRRRANRQGEKPTNEGATRVLLTNDSSGGY